MSFWSAITGTTPQSEQEANLQKQKDLFNQRLQDRIDEGTISDQKAKEYQDYVGSLSLEDTDAAAAAGFKEGAVEGLNNVLSAPGKVVSGAGWGVGKILAGFPWWFWPLLIIGVLFYLGAGPWLLKRGRDLFKEV